MPDESPKKAAARGGNFYRVREKVEQWCRDVWRPYHGSTAHRQDSDGNQMVEKKKSGGHMPLNAAVMAFHDPSEERQIKLLFSRDMFMRELYRLACGSPKEVVMFSEIQDLFRDYGAGDSDYDELREKAQRFGQDSESARKLYAVDAGIDLITERLIEAGVRGKDFWADFPHGGVPTDRTKGKEERYKRYYLLYLDFRTRLAAETKPDGTPKYKRVTNKALKMTAEECGVSKQTIITAVQEYESGYISLEESD